MGRWKSFDVRFSCRDFYTVTVKARSADEAIRRAEDLFTCHGADPARGFVFDVSEGGTDGWDATECAA